MPASLAEITSLANGSHFLRADLHVHTFGGSRDVRDARLTINAIIDAAVTKGISILAITDHNTAVNVQAAFDYAQRYADTLLLVPGVEITTSHGHLLAYLEEPSQVDELLTFLRITGRSADSDGHASASMADAISQIQQIGGIALAAHIDREKTGFEMNPGYQNWKRDILTHAGLFGLEGDNDSHLVWYSLDDVGQNATERKKLYVSRRDAGVRWPLAHVQSSDAHDFDRFVSAESLTRIKLDELSFAALRLAFKDPEARVRATVQVPTYYPRIVGVSIDGGFLDGQALHFSPNLNCLFGGRGAGKSTAIRVVAHTLAAEETIGDRDDCPTCIWVYTEDANGSTWCFRKERGSSVVGFAADDPSNAISPESFPIEYYAQNDLARVSESLTTDGKLLQEFLDRHLALGDLRDRERLTRSSLRDIAATLLPIEASFAQLPKLKLQVEELDKRLKAAEEEKLKEGAAAQAALGNERQFLNSLRSAIEGIRKKLSLNAVRIDFEGNLEAAQPLLRFKPSPESISKITQSFAEYSEAVDKIADTLKQVHEKLNREFELVAADLAKSYLVLEEKINKKLADLKGLGLKGSIEDLHVQIRSRSRLADQVAVLQRRMSELQDLRTRRADLLKEVYAIRAEWERRRKEQLRTVNRSLGRTIADFKVVFLYDEAGHQQEYFEIVSRTMNGTYFPDEQIRKLCIGSTPQELANWVRANDEKVLRDNLGGLEIDAKWATAILHRFSLDKLYELEEAWNPA